MIDSQRREHIQRIGDERILGDSDFVARMLSLDEIGFARYAKHQYARWELSKVVRAICEYFDIPPENISNKGRDNDLARARCAIAYLATTECGCKVSEIANYLSVTSAAVSKMKRQGREFCAQSGLSLATLNQIS